MVTRSPGLRPASNGKLGSLPRFENAAGTGVGAAARGSSGCWASARADRALLDLATGTQQYTGDPTRGKREDRQTTRPGFLARIPA